MHKKEDKIRRGSRKGKEMDQRSVLEKNITLCFQTTEGGSVSYVIEKEIGRGGSCIVYEGFYRNHSGMRMPVRIKECFPYALQLVREASGEISVPKNQRTAFEHAKKIFRKSFEINNEIFRTAGLTNFTVNIFNLYEANHTLYMVSSYAEGRVLALEYISSIKEAAGIVKNVAVLLKRLHDRGYLYLDLKPENVFVLQGMGGAVQLFDFDSLIPLSKKESLDEYRFSYSEGFAAPEQRLRNYYEIGMHTDVFAIGALFYYLVFGKCADAQAQAPFAEYDFTDLRYGKAVYQDTLFRELTGFFRHTLAVWYEDRYADMVPVIERLERIEKVADLKELFLTGSYLPEKLPLFGREEESKYLNGWISDASKRCLFISGMGGIGKSTLVKANLAEKRELFDAVIYLYYEGSLERMIADDERCYVNTIHKTEEENISDYFRRKLSALRKIAEEKTLLLVIDDYDGLVDEPFLDIINVGWKVIVLTRRGQEDYSQEEFLLREIRERDGIYSLFSYYAKWEEQGKIWEEKERILIDRIAERVNRHTLALELIAKQIAKGHLSLETAAALTEQYGFSAISEEKIPYEKDGRQYMETISRIIAALFSVGEMSEKRKMLLKMLSLFGSYGVQMQDFSELLSLQLREDVHDLADGGWLHVSGDVVSMHPVIRAYFSEIRWTKEAKKAVRRLMGGLDKKLELYGQKKVYPRQKTEQEKQILSHYMKYAEPVLTKLRGIQFMRQEAGYYRLLYSTLWNMPREREDFIFSYRKKRDFLLPKGFVDIEKQLRVLDYIIYICCDKKEFGAAEQYLSLIGEIVKKQKKPYLWGLYYDTIGEICDAALDGAYDAQTAEERYWFRRFIRSTDQAVYYMKASDRKEREKHLVRFYLTKADLLIRGNTGTVQEIRKLIYQVKSFMKRSGREEPELEAHYYLVCGWYYVHVEPDGEKVKKCIMKAEENTGLLYQSNLDYIDFLIIPAADMLYEIGDMAKSSGWLEKGIRLCAEHEGVLPYERKAEELRGYLSEVR